MIVYVWSRRNATTPVAIWGAILINGICTTSHISCVGFQFEGLYLPWALIAFTVLIGGNPIMDICGVVAGHLYYFLLEVLPNLKGWRVLQTPQILYVQLDALLLIYTHEIPLI